MDDKQKQKVSSLTKALETHHAELSRLSQQIASLEQQKAVIKGSAITELLENADALRLPKEAIGNLVAGCW